MIRRDAYVEKMLRLTGNGNIKVVTGDYQDPWKDDAGVMHIGVIPFLLDKTLIEKW